MSVISLTIAPLMKGDKDWDVWYYGLIPLAVMIIGTYLVYYFFWREMHDITADVGGDTEAEKPAEKMSDPEVGKEDVEA